jgi:2-dehydro-3-deoxygluconokinase
MAPDFGLVALPVRSRRQADEPAGLVALLFALGARRVVLKCGAEGAWFAEAPGDAPQHVPAHAVQARDATGAGDCFDGSLLARLAAGDALPQAVRYADVAAALSTRAPGAVAPIPHRDEVLQAMQALTAPGR